jgi:hypothetical protein
MKRRKLLAVGFLVAFVALFSLVLATCVPQVRIPASGDIKAVGLEVYSDPACTISLVSVDWGLLSPGETKSLVCYLKSTSNVNASLLLSLAGWDPAEAEEYITLVWDQEGAVITPDTVLPAEFTLHVDSAVHGISSFSFDVVISAMEAI